MAGPKILGVVTTKFILEVRTTYPETIMDKASEQVFHQVLSPITVGIEPSPMYTESGSRRT